MSDLNAMDLLREEMENEEVFIKVNAIHRVCSIANVLGHEATRSQLLPYLESLISYESDEVLFAIAQQIANLQNCIAGPLTSLLPPLETLCTCDETVVRDQAQSSLVSASANLHDSEITNHYCTLLLRLANGDTFASRVSAINLFVSAYPRAGAQKDKLRQKFIELCHEETPMVRRASAAQIGQLGILLEKDYLVQELIPVFRNLAQDDQDQVRTLIIQSLIPLAKNFSKEDNLRHTLPVALAAGEDKSWRVRLQFARTFSELAHAFGKDIVDTSLIQTFTLLLKDNESEVKKEAIKSLPATMELLSQDKLHTLVLPIVTSLVSEAQTSAVKAHIAETLAAMAKFLGKDQTLLRLQASISELLRDDNAEVKLFMIKSLNEMLEPIGSELISPSTQQSLAAIIKDQNWRVREAAYQLFANVGLQFGQEFFMKNIQELFFGYLSEQVSAVRETGVKYIKLLGDAFKEDWIQNHMMPVIQEQYYKDNSYLIRITSLQSLFPAFIHLPYDVVLDSVLPFLARASKDNVPNVRFAVCMMIDELSPQLNSGSLKARIQPILQELNDDADFDVKYFAAQAISKFE